FFAFIRSCYNQRVDYPGYQRLGFCLIGVATPSDFIQDKNRTPFNIGRAIELSGFKLQEAQPLAQGFAACTDNTKKVLQEVLFWTGGQPFLTQKLCHLVSLVKLPIIDGQEAKQIKQLVYLSVIKDWKTQDNPEHLRTIINRLLNNEQLAGRLLGLYQQILQQGEIVADESIEQNKLRLSGLVVERRSKLKVYNSIYQAIFDENWVNEKLAHLRPYSEAINAWEKSKFIDQSRLLRGQALQDSQAWAIGKSLSDLDYKFLAASQELDKRQVQRNLEAEIQARQILVKANKKANQKIGIGSIVLVITLIVAALTGTIATQQVNNANKKVTAIREEIKNSNQKLKLAQTKAKQAEDKNRLSEAKSQEAKNKSRLSEAKSQKAENKSRLSEAKSQEAEQKLKVAQEATKKADQALTAAKSELAEVNEEAKQKNEALEEAVQKSLVATQRARMAAEKAVKARQATALAEQIRQQAQTQAQNAQGKLLQLDKVFADIQQDMRHRVGEARTLTNIGKVYSNIGQPQKALKYFNQGLEILKQAGNPSREARALTNIGEVYSNIGQPQKALKYFYQELPIQREVSDRRGEGVTLNKIGKIYNYLGQLKKALDYYNRALPIHHEVNNWMGEAETLNNLGEVYQVIGQPEKALDYYNQALLIHREVDDRMGEAETLNNLGEVYQAIGQPEKALDYYNQALLIHREVDDRMGEAETLNNLGEVYQAIGQPQQALNYYGRALQLQQEISDRSGEGVTLSNIAHLNESRGNTAQAIDFYQQAIKVKESILGSIKVEELKASFASLQVDTYTRIINLYGEQGNFEAAFNYAERVKARAFLYQFANSRMNISASADPQLLKQEQALKTEIIALSQGLITIRNRPKKQWDNETIAETENQLNAREKDYENLLTQLKIQSPETADLISVDVASLGDIQGWLDADTTLVEYFVTDQRTFAFIITKNTFKTILLNVSPQQLTEELTLFRDFFDLNEPYPQELQQLHKWLILPLQPHLNTTKIGIVPHSVLHYLPFAALTDGKRYLSDDYVLFSLPSASLLRYLPEKRKSVTGSILAIGAPESTGISPLNYAQQEVTAIANLFNTQPLIGKDATESAVWSKANQSGILHLATHGVYNNPFNPLFNSIQLVGDPQHDGSLQVHEIYELDLSTATNLVVLSASQTKIGELSRGDEVVGLNRAFLYAGTPSVIASLWNVDDASTGLLMKRFYTYLLSGIGKAEALRQAQIDVRKEYPHPYYWAAFVLTGDWGSL
ncbi:MAG: CHAT domain-containing protein, partial [Symploca sp. SIO1B1]|nr:CHAT domain-containing protein [Symploca sp. SIO1B1]